ncbi:MAG: Calx-beta domain-containing protein, partial [Acidobacteriota bacterium]
MIRKSTRLHSLWLLFAWPVALLAASAAHAGPVGTYSLVVDNPTALSADEGVGSINFDVIAVGFSCPDSFGGVTWDVTRNFFAGADAADAPSHTPTVASFNSGNLAANVDVVITDDMLLEGPETFEIVFTALAPEINCPSLGGVIVPSTGSFAFILEILDNEFDTPEFTVSPVTVDESAGQAIFQVELLDPPPSGTSTVEVLTQDGTATAGADYQPVSTTVLTFDFVSPVKQVAVDILDDSVPEGDEDFTLLLQNPIGADLLVNQALGTIEDNDLAGGPEISIFDAPTALEGAAAPGDRLQFRVELTSPIPRQERGVVQVDFLTLDGTALEGEDYAGSAGTLVFPAGVTQRIVSIPVLDDGSAEATEEMFVLLENPVGATLVADKARGLIDDDDAQQGLPTLGIGDAQVEEGDGDDEAREAVFTLRLSSAFQAPVSVRAETREGSATAGEDFISSSRLVFFDPGQTEQQVRVAVIGDAVPEADETFSVVLSGPLNAIIVDSEGVGTILDDDEAEASTLTIEDSEVVEGNPGSGGEMLFDVRLQPPSDGAVTVRFATSDETAEAGLDYLASQGTLTFAPGETLQNLAIRVAGDRLSEADETLRVTLSNADGA